MEINVIEPRRVVAVSDIPNCDLFLEYESNELYVKTSNYSPPLTAHESRTIVAISVRSGDEVYFSGDKKVILVKRIKVFT